MEKSAPAGIQKAEEVEKVFNRFDADRDGKISASELGSVVRPLGSGVSDEEVHGMIREMDADRDGFVSLQEFAHFHRPGGSGGATARGETDLKDAFDLYDLDGNGLISARELQHLLEKLGEKCSTHDCSRMIGSVDSDGDGYVNFEEFKKMMGAGGGGEKEGEAAAGY